MNISLIVCLSLLAFCASTEARARRPKLREYFLEDEDDTRRDVEEMERDLEEVRRYLDGPGEVYETRDLTRGLPEPMSKKWNQAKTAIQETWAGTKKKAKELAAKVGKKLNNIMGTNQNEMENDLAEEVKRYRDESEEIIDTRDLKSKVNKLREKVKKAKEFVKENTKKIPKEVADKMSKLLGEITTFLEEAEKESQPPTFKTKVAMNGMKKTGEKLGKFANPKS